MPEITVLSVSGETLLEDVYPPDLELVHLATQAAALLGERRCRLVRGAVEVPASASIGALGLADGSVLTAVAVHGIKIYASKRGKAFAAVKGDGSVVCWGDARYGGDCAAVREQLVD